MALPTLTTFKAYCRVETTAEDTLLTGLLASATARITAWLNRAITALSRAYVIEDPRGSALGVNRLSYDPRAGVPFIRIPDAPVASSPAPVIVDADGDTVDASTYRIDNTTGIVRGICTTFGRFPYTATATTGLATRSDYTTNVEPVIAQAILDLGADLHQRRNPAATQETDGAGGSVTFGRVDEELPARIRGMLAPFRAVTL